MTPSQTAQALRHIAAKIQNSKNPDRILVTQDLNAILAAFLDPQDPAFPHETSKVDPYGFDAQQALEQASIIMDNQGSKNPEDIVAELQEVLGKVG